MKRAVIVILLLILGGKIALPFMPVLNASQASENDIVTLFPDRNIYVVGEHIQFAAYIKSKDEINSRILYVEIIAQGGRSVNSGKFKITEGKVNGSLVIPDDILSGNYFIKAYTRWMRNFGTSSYSFTPIKIANPLNHTPQASIINGNGNPINFEKLAVSDHAIITPDQTEYKTREIGTLKIEQNNTENSIKWICLSIAPSAVFTHEISTIEYHENSQDNSFYFNPERKGFTITAKVLNSETLLPAPFSLVNLSILGPFADFLASRTDSNGFYSINLPEITGSYDIYVGVKEDSKSTVRFDNDFCTNTIKFNYPPFSLSEVEHIAANNIIKNLEVSRHFGDSLTNKNLEVPKEKSTNDPFYGTPDNIYIFDNYIDLLSVKEYFYELFPVSVKEKGGRASFRIHGNYSEFDIYEPLVLIDNIVVDNADRILAADPNLLSRVEIVSKPYYKGNMVYGGIVSFFSKQGDFAGIELSPSDMFIKYKFFSEDNNSRVSEIKNDDIPDARNTVLWINDLILSEKGNTSVDFQTPDTKGSYEVVLRGIDSKGEIVLVKNQFSVK
jgi:hypothetical protein